METMRTNRIVALAGLGLALAAALFVSRPAVGADDEAAGVQASCTAFKAAWNKHDAKAMAALFSEDATHLDPSGTKLDVGRAEIEKMLTGMMGATGPFRESTLVVNTEIVRFPAPGAALTDADATVSNVMGADGSKSSMELHVVNVWKKVGGQWQVYACRPYVKGGK
jgi:uncharacterized protein (TIGR02246 family)